MAPRRPNDAPRIPIQPTRGGRGTGGGKKGKKERKERKETEDTAQESTCSTHLCPCQNSGTASVNLESPIKSLTDALHCDPVSSELAPLCYFLSFLPQKPPHLHDWPSCSPQPPRAPFQEACDLWKDALDSVRHRARTASAQPGPLLLERPAHTLPVVGWLAGND